MSRSTNDKERVIFSRPELTLVNETLNAELRSLLDDGEHIQATGGWIDGRATFRAAVATFDRSRVLRAECATAVPPDDAKELLVARAALVEFMAAMLEEWLNTERIRSPHIEWREYTYEGREFLYRASLHDEATESLADRWLREHGLDEHGEPLTADAGAGASEDDTPYHVIDATADDDEPTRH